MKTLFKLASTALLTWVGAAPALAAAPANLAITSERGQPFSLVLDGHLLTRPVAPQVRVGMLAPGRHWAEFSVPTGYGPPLQFRTTVWLQPGLETDYVLVMQPYGPQLRQVGVVALAGYGQGGYYGPGNVPYGNGPGGYYGNARPPVPPQGTYSNGQYDPGYDPRGSYPSPGPPQAYPAPAPAYPGQQQPRYPAPTYPSQEQPQGYPVPANPSQEQPQSYPAPASPDQEQPQAYPAPTPAPAYPSGANSAPGTTYPDTTTDGGYYPSQGNAANLRPFSPEEITGLVQDLRQRSTEAERLRTATQALDQSSLRADELAELMQTFPHDESRIELARFSYSHLSDPQNFSRVYEALQFKSSIRTLRQAVGLPQE